ncbi:MAG: cation:proton antiporter [Bacteroidota bacterium]
MLSLPITDPVLIVSITMGILLLGPILFERLRIPGLVGLIVLGAAVGPGGLGLLERDATFELLGTFGLLYLMFLAGVTLDLGEFTKRRGQSITFGLLSFSLPMGLAVLVGQYVLGYDILAAALLGAIVGSHTLLALPLAARLGIGKNGAMVAATGATLITDLVSLLVLAIVQGSASGEADTAFWLRFAGLASLWGIFVMVIVPRLGRVFFRRVGREGDTPYVFLLAIVFVSAWLAGLVGLAPIIGAFLAGIALNRLVPKKSPLMTRIEFVGNALFIPFFLVSVGLLVDVRVLGSLEVWKLALVATGLVVVGKGSAALLSWPLFKWTRAEAFTVAGLTMPQAAATLAVTLIGFDIGLFGREAVNAIVLVILITCLVGPSLVRRFGRDVALAERAAPVSDGSAPQRIVVPLSNPTTAEELTELAMLLRTPNSEESIFPLAVARGGPEEAQNVARAEQVLERAVIHAAAADVPCLPTVRIAMNPAVGILRGAREVRGSIIVAGWGQTSTAGTVLYGSVLDKVIEESREMVVMARLNKRINSVQRMVLLVPPMAHQEIGFAGALHALKSLSSQNGMPILVLAAENYAKAVQKTIDGVKPSAKVTVQPLAQWRDAMKTLKDLVTPDDMVVLLSVREGALAWRPALKRMPRLLSLRHEDNDLLVVYLSEVELDALVEGALDEPRAGVRHAKLLPPHHITLGLSPTDLPSLLTTILQPGYPTRPQLPGNLADDLADAHENYAPELSPGIVFYHEHSAWVDEPALFLGTCPQGVQLPHTSQPAYVILILVAPKKMKPAAYLTQLSLTAQLVRPEDTVDHLLAVKTSTAAAEYLLGNLHDTGPDDLDDLDD